MRLVVDAGHLVEVVRLVVGSQAQVEPVVLPAEHQVADRVGVVRQVDAALHTLPLDVRVGLAEGGVGAQQQAIPRRRQPVELLRVGQLQAVELRAAAVLEAQRFVERGPLAGAGQIGVVDEVVDVLVEQIGRHHAGAAHVVLDAEVVVDRFQRFEIGVAELGCVVFDDETGRQLAEGRAHHAVGPGGADHGVVGQLVAHMQAGQPVVVVIAAGDGLELTVAQPGALGAEARAFVAQAGDDAPAVDIHGVHQVGGVDVLVHVEVIDARLLLIVELAGIQTADRALDGRGADAWAEAAERVVDVAALEIGQGQVVEIVVLPDFVIVVLVPAAELAAELGLRGVTLDVVFTR